MLEKICKNHGIALTGGIASGKSMVAKILHKMGYTVIDADRLVGELLSTPEVVAELKRAFGEEVFRGPEVDRQALGRLVFAQKEKRSTLEAIVHPLLPALLEEKLRKAGLFDNPKTFFYEAALIIEKGRASSFREVWLTHIPEAEQCARLTARDNISYDEAMARIRSQMPSAEKLKHADFVLDTSLSSSELLNTISVRLKNNA